MMPAILIETDVPASWPIPGFEDVQLVRVTVGNNTLPVFLSTVDGLRWMYVPPEGPPRYAATQADAVCGALGITALTNWDPGRPAGLLKIGQRYDVAALPPILGWTAAVPGGVTLADYFWEDGRYMPGGRLAEPVFEVTGDV